MWEHILLISSYHCSITTITEILTGYYCNTPKVQKKKFFKNERNKAGQGKKAARRTLTCISMHEYQRIEKLILIRNLKTEQHLTILSRL